MLVIGCLVVVAIPFVIYAMSKPSWRDPQAAAEFAPFHWEQPAATGSGMKAPRNDSDTSKTPSK